MFPQAKTKSYKLKGKLPFHNEL